MQAFASKVAVITGGSQGLGAAIAALFAARGAQGIVICGRSRDKGEAKACELSETSGADVRFVQTNLESVDDCRALIASADSRFGRIDVLVNAAAMTDRGTSWSFPTNGARGRVREAQDASTAALAHFDGVVLNALRETETSLATYVADYARTEALHAALKSATESANETHRLYVGGRESFISDLDATRTLTATRAQVAAAEGQVALDQANLFLALGGGWETADNVPATPPAK